ncbi:glycoside hydrolase family 99-like domain-containing protein [Geomonas subterranea]|uniref:Glycoside hydrolase family 99-like domain-containing protein n=1 Tax=Geomonas subterranea TaxID=2847989 RepID=A0ABX8LGQ1_9BACT|nr:MULTISPECIES: glycoside hydrolase family 99-like domain-containing protein [Geomonas]QXE90913.1 glycoside hydrolase family 99-like domain-containing protein [Geomonas subterranea]QXM11001.1 glycoside hydrolase family 99-like domain-containing protein [Geomonas subterranea]
MTVNAVAAILLTQSAYAGELRPVVGAIRWDAWYAGSPYEYSLSAPQWRGRLPFYATNGKDGRASLRADSQEVMDREIVLASAAGIDYWAFCYYSTRHNPALAQLDEGLRRYLASARKNEIRFCLILETNHLGPVEDWPVTIKRLVAFFKEPTYQTVAGGRPLLFLFDPGEMEKWAGSSAAVKAMLGELDRAALDAGLQEPYMAAQGGEPARVSNWVEKFDLDAISAYTAPGTGGDGEYPHSALAEANRGFWEACKALAKQTIPIVNAGWDNRPRRNSTEQARKLRGPWYVPPTPAELARHLKSAIEWERANPEYTEADAIIIYAWNESDEGGWLVPTLTEGDARLQAIKSVLRTREPATSPAPGRTPSAAAPLPSN